MAKEKKSAKEKKTAKEFARLVAEKIGPGADVKIHADPTFGWRAQPIAKRGQAAEF